MDTPASVVRSNAAGRIIVLCAALGSVLWFIRNRARRHLAAGALLVIAVLDGLTHAPWHNPTAPAWVYAGPAAEMQSRPTLGESRAMISPEAAFKLDHLIFNDPAEDVLAARIALFSNMNLLEGIPKVDGFFAVYPRRISELQKALYRTTNSLTEGTLDFLGVSQMNPPGSWSKWQTRNSALPLITSPAKIRITERSLEEMLGANFDPRAEALAGKDAAFPTHSLARAQIEGVKWQPEQVSFTATAAGTALVTIAQTYFSPWKCFVEGQSIEIIPINHAFQAIVLPPGRHSVRLEYRDRAFQIGGYISVFFLVAAIGSILLNRKAEA